MRSRQLALAIPRTLLLVASSATAYGVDFSTLDDTIRTPSRASSSR
jgi:hypothetical protein